MMQPNHEADDLSELLEAGYAAPPLDAAFSGNLVRRMQAAVVPQSSLPRNRRLHWAMVLGGASVAASILAVLFVWNSLGPTPNEVAMESVPGSSVELSTSLESKSTKSLEAKSNPIDAKSSETEPLVLSRDSEEARGTPVSQSITESLVETESEVSRDVKKTQESISAAVMEEFEIVTKDRAKALGLSISSQADGPDAARVNLEFEKQGELKEYNRVELKQFNGDKLLLSVSLKEGESKPSRVIVDFVAARSHLATLSLEIVAKDRGTRVRYVLPMKDFISKPKGLTQP